MFTDSEGKSDAFTNKYHFNKRQVLMDGTRKLPSPLGLQRKQSFPAKVLGKDLEGIYPFRLGFQD